MRYVMTAAVVGLAALLWQGQATGQKKEAPAPHWAKVTLGGEIRDLLELRAKHNLYVLLDRDIPMTPRSRQWQGPPPKPVNYPVRSVQVGEASWVVALLDENSDQLKGFLPKLRAGEQPVQVIFEGAIAAAAKDAEPFVTYANATGKLRVVGKAELGMGDIRVEGQAQPGKYEIGKGQSAALAIENGNSPILITGEAVAKVASVRGTARVTGKLILHRQGPLVVEAQSITIVPPAPKPAPKPLPKKKKAK